MRARRAIAIGLYSLVGGVGGGFAMAGDWKRGFAWLAAATVAVMLGVALSPWLYALVGAAIVGSIAHAVAREWKTNAPLKPYSSWPLTMLFANVGCALVLNMAFIGEYVNAARGMGPGIEPGDRVIVDKSSPQWRPIDHGDVIVFDRYECSDVRDLGRVVATAEETVEVRCGVLYVDSPAGHRVIEDKADAPDFPPLAWKSPFPRVAAHSHGLVGRLEAGTSGHVCDRQLAYSVPAQHVFVMNDQRAYDSDSRTWGPVELDQIEGRVQLVWWSH